MSFAIDWLIRVRLRRYMQEPRDTDYSTVPAHRFVEEQYPALVRSSLAVIENATTATQSAYDGSAGKVVADAALLAPIVCRQRQGDLIYVPRAWGHGVLNLMPSVGYANEYQADQTRARYSAE
jgi:hypothetical protein